MVRFLLANLMDQSEPSYQIWIQSSNCWWINCTVGLLIMNWKNTVVFCWWSLWINCTVGLSMINNNKCSCVLLMDFFGLFHLGSPLTQIYLSIIQQPWSLLQLIGTLKKPLKYNQIMNYLHWSIFLVMESKYREIATLSQVLKKYLLWLITTCIKLVLCQTIHQSISDVNLVWMVLCTTCEEFESILTRFSKLCTLFDKFLYAFKN